MLTASLKNWLPALIWECLHAAYLSLNEAVSHLQLICASIPLCLLISHTLCLVFFIAHYISFLLCIVFLHSAVGMKCTIRALHLLTLTPSAAHFFWVNSQSLPVRKQVENREERKWAKGKTNIMQSACGCWRIDWYHCLVYIRYHAGSLWLLSRSERQEQISRAQEIIHDQHIDGLLLSGWFWAFLL